MASCCILNYEDYKITPTQINLIVIYTGILSGFYDPDFFIFWIRQVENN